MQQKYIVSKHAVNIKTRTVQLHNWHIYIYPMSAVMSAIEYIYQAFLIFVVTINLV